MPAEKDEPEAAVDKLGTVADRISKHELNSTNSNHSGGRRNFNNEIASSEDSASTSTPNGSTTGNNRVMAKVRMLPVKPARQYIRMSAKFSQVYYHIDDEPTPYCVSIDVGPEDSITLVSIRP